MAAEPNAGNQTGRREGGARCPTGGPRIKACARAGLRGGSRKGRNWPRLKGVTTAIGAGVNAACSMTQNGQVALVVASVAGGVVVQV